MLVVPAHAGTHTPCVLSRAVRQLPFLQLAPGVMGPRVRGDDELIDFAVFLFYRIRLDSDPNHRHNPPIPSHQKGRLAIVTKRGAGCGGRGRADNERHDRVRRSRVVLTPGLLASSPGEANASRGRWWQEAPIHQGEHDISRKAIAQGRPECFR